MGWTGNKSETLCPMINHDHPRCGGRLSLGHIDEAFEYCLGGYLACPAYQHLSWEQHALEHSHEFAPAQRPTVAAARQAFAELTVGGQALNAVDGSQLGSPRLTLRRTGA